MLPAHALVRQRRGQAFGLALYAVALLGCDQLLRYRSSLADEGQPAALDSSVDLKGPTCSNADECPAHPRMTASCVEGECSYACLQGWGNCDDDLDSGCEVALRSTDHCLQCGGRCAAGEQCFSFGCSDAPAVAWAHLVEAELSDVTGVATDSEGNLYLTGRIKGTHDFDGDGAGGLSSPDIQSGYVVSLDPSLHVRWEKILSCSGCGAIDTPICKNLALDTDGSVLVVGQFGGLLVVDGWSLTSQGRDFFALKIDTDGTTLWAMRYGGQGVEYAYAIAPGAGDTAFVAADLSGTSTFETSAGPVTIASKGGSDMLLAAVGADGTLDWVEGYGAVGDDVASFVDARPGGPVCFSGSFVGDVSFSGSIAVSSEGLKDALVVCLDSNRDVLWARSFGAQNNDRAVELAILDDGDVLVTGELGSGSYAFGPVPAGQSAAFLARLTGAGGAAQWIAPLVAAQATGYAVEASGDRAYVAGNFIGTLSVGGKVFSSTARSSEDWDVFVASFDLAGTPRWSLSLPTTSSAATPWGKDVPWILHRGPDDRLYLSGELRGDAVVGSEVLRHPSPGSPLGFIVAFQE